MAAEATPTPLTITVTTVAAVGAQAMPSLGAHLDGFGGVIASFASSCGEAAQDAMATLGVNDAQIDVAMVIDGGVGVIVTPDEG